MQIVKPYAKMIGVDNREDGIELLRWCEAAARISHRSEDKMTPDSYDRFLRFIVMEHGDFSVIEHRIVTVEFLVDRGISHEIVRHRLFSYTQESTRFVNYAKKMPPSFIYPSDWQGTIDPRITDEHWAEVIDKIEALYRLYVDTLGLSPQLARNILPNCLATKLWATGNLRNWRHFFLMRTCAEAHPQMREVAIPLLEEFQGKIPILYEDIVPLEKQSKNMRKMR